jgi:hypothetical protein
LRAPLAIRTGKEAAMKNFLFVSLAVGFSLLLLSSSCAPPLTLPTEELTQDAAPSDNPIPETKPIAGDAITAEDLGNGVTKIRANASDAEKWIYYSFASKAQIMPEDPKDSTEWTIAFRRFLIKTNGGISGRGGVEVAILDNQEFDLLQKAPANGYLVDQEDGEDTNTDPDYAFLLQDAWYRYNVADHTLTPRKRVYVVKEREQYYKVEMLGYYDQFGNSGFPAFRWAPLQPPSP